MFTTADLKEVRPGVLKLDGHDFYVITVKKEKCDACNGTGKISGRSKTGRRTTRGCFPCGKTGQCTPSWNLAAQYRGCGQRMESFDVSMDSILARLNGEHGLSSYLQHPTFMTLI
jgi:hypothetical protein